MSQARSAGNANKWTLAHCIRTNNVRSSKFIIKLAGCSKYTAILCNRVLVVAHVTVSLWGSLSRTLGYY